jgi:hypothetical protein
MLHWRVRLLFEKWLESLPIAPRFLAEPTDGPLFRPSLVRWAGNDANQLHESALSLLDRSVDGESICAAFRRFTEWSEWGISDPLPQRIDRPTPMNDELQADLLKEF